MKIVLWVGNEPNQKALACKINSLFPVSGIVIETRSLTRKISVLKLVEKIIEKLFLPSVGISWKKMLAYFHKSYPDFPDTQILKVENINAESAYNFTSEIGPDLILVSGTRLIKDRMLSIGPKIGILNLHTGISPYVKGGPNCTNWCIANGQFHLIGNTVMCIDSGIDSGNLVATEFTEFNGSENLTGIHIKVMEHAHNLYLRSIGKVLKGEYSTVKQSSILKGKTYFTKQWTLGKKIKLILNMKKFSKTINSSSVAKLRETVTLVKI
jgi:methionyl-tRNA formyltransferase